MKKEERRGNRTLGVHTCCARRSKKICFFALPEGNSKRGFQPRGCVGRPTPGQQGVVIFKNVIIASGTDMWENRLLISEREHSGVALHSQQSILILFKKCMGHFHQK